MMNTEIKWVDYFEVIDEGLSDRSNLLGKKTCESVIVNIIVQMCLWTYGHKAQPHLPRL